MIGAKVRGRGNAKASAADKNPYHFCFGVDFGNICYAMQMNWVEVCTTTAQVAVKRAWLALPLFSVTRSKPEEIAAIVVVVNAVVTTKVTAIPCLHRRTPLKLPY